MDGIAMELIVAIVGFIVEVGLVKYFIRYGIDYYQSTKKDWE